MILYTKENFEKLKHKFNLSETIEKNYSQAYQDMFVLSMLNGKKNGTYVEIGAMDAVFINNTYLLESQFDWKGVSFDIDQSSKNSFITSGRKNSFVLGDALMIDFEKIFEENNFGRQIDYLQLDIEPQIQTLNCLKQLPLDKYRFSVITYETDLYDKSAGHEESLKNRDESRAFLLSHGYELVVGNIANNNPDEIFEDWYVDPTAIDKNILDIMRNSSEYNNTAESYMLNL